MVVVSNQVVTGLLVVVLLGPVMLVHYHKFLHSVVQQSQFSKNTTELLMPKASPIDISVFTEASMTTSSIPFASDCSALDRNMSCGNPPFPPFQAPLDSCHKFRSTSGKPNPGLLQQIHFEQALEEECTNTTNRQIGVDHQSARVFLDNCTMGIIFPRSLVAYCSCGVWNDAKNISFFFLGANSGGRSRSWLMDYANESHAEVEFSWAGRSIRKTTGLYDYPYYDKLMSSRFALAPDGDFAWTYRFIEGIMCGAIPIVVNRTKPEEQELGFEYCTAGHSCAFMTDETARKEAAIRNWIRFIRQHSLVVELDGTYFDVPK